MLMQEVTGTSRYCVRHQHVRNTQIQNSAQRTMCSFDQNMPVKTCICVHEDKKKCVVPCMCFSMMHVPARGGQFEFMTGGFCNY